LKRVKAIPSKIGEKYAHAGANGKPICWLFDEGFWNASPKGPFQIVFPANVQELQIPRLGLDLDVKPPFDRPTGSKPSDRHNLAQIQNSLSRLELFALLVR
jgi:hypothetical protein